jgi:peptidyl-prolyl cis-trans isomerase C
VKATARHILVDSEDEAFMLMKKLNSGESSFEVLAKEYSNCPSASDGGSLGTFEPGTMVLEFDKAVFSPKTIIGAVVGPIQTKFGYHLIVVEKRSGGGDWY